MNIKYDMVCFINIFIPLQIVNNENISLQFELQNIDSSGYNTIDIRIDSKTNIVNNGYRWKIMCAQRPTNFFSVDPDVVRLVSVFVCSS